MKRYYFLSKEVEETVKTHDGLVGFKTVKPIAVGSDFINPFAQEETLLP